MCACCFFLYASRGAIKVCQWWPHRCLKAVCYRAWNEEADDKLTPLPLSPQRCSQSWWNESRRPLRVKKCVCCNTACTNTTWAARSICSGSVDYLQYFKELLASLQFSSVFGPLVPKLNQIYKKISVDIKITSLYRKLWFSIWSGEKKLPKCPMWPFLESNYFLVELTVINHFYKACFNFASHHQANKIKEPL